jgi:putative pyoverdin transport system ATP-binding/permease protein
MNLIGFLLRASRGVAALAIVAGVAGGVGGVALIALIQAGLAQEPPPAAWLARAFAGLCLAVVATRVVAQACMARVAQRSVAELCSLLPERILDVPLRRFEEIGPSALVAILTEDVVVVANSLAGVPLILINLPIVVACFAYVGWLSPAALACAVGFAAPAILVYDALARRAMSRLRRARDGQDALVARFRTLIDGFKELAMHRGRRAAFLERELRPAAATVRDHSTAGLTTFAVAAGWGQLMSFAFIGTALFVLPHVQDLGRPALGGVVLAALYVMSPLDVILTWLPILGRARASLAKIEALGSSLDGARGAPVVRRGPLALRSSLQLAGVTYAYRGGPGEDGFALGPVDLVLRPGESVFLVGGNGSGKTTLVKLIAGLYEPQAGEVRLDGRPVRPEDRDDYRQLFAAVFADGHLFGSLLGLDRPDLDASARDLLARFELGDKVRVEAGAFSTTDLSLGQRRRLALLTACLEDRPVCLFDEWTSHQDARSREVFYLDLLPRLKAEGKAVLVISHDEDYFPTADRVLRIRGGRLDAAAPEPYSPPAFGGVARAGIQP